MICALEDLAMSWGSHSPLLAFRVICWSGSWSLGKHFTASDWLSKNAKEDTDEEMPRTWVMWEEARSIHTLSSHF